MLEKNKDYIEMRVSSTDCAFTQNAPTQISVDGYVYTTYMNMPDPGELYILISKEKFESLQADNQHYRELAKQREENYKTLLDKTGFYNLADLMCYLPKDKTFKSLIDAYETDLISKTAKNETLHTENKQLKKKLGEFSPVPGYREFLKALYPEGDVEKLVWATEQLCSGRDLQHSLQVDLTYYQALSSARARLIDSLKQNYETLSKLVGFSSTEEIQDYLTNEAECDTLHEAISKLKDQVKYTCEEWYSANSRNNSWKAAAECNSPKELIEKIEGLEGKVKVLETEVEVYSRALQEWKAGTNCPSPSAAKTLIESGVSWHHAYRDVKVENEKLADEVKSRQKKIDELRDVIYSNSGVHYCTDVWQKATGCDTPEEAGCKINNLCDEICKLKGDYDHLLELTGYKNEKGICAALVFSDENHLYITMRDLINSLKRKVKFTESNWQNATSCDTPEKAQYKITDLYNRIDKMKEAASIASNWTDKIVEG